jgi:hypothetical protein
VSQQTYIPTTLARTSQSRREAGLLLVLAFPHLEARISPSTPSPKDRFFAWQGTEDDGERTTWFIHSLLLQPNRWPASPSGSTAVRLHWRPERDGSLQTGVSVKRHLSRIFPTHPRSLARCLSRALRHGASLLRLRRPTGYGFQKIFCAKNKNAKRFSEPSVKAPLGTWERGTSRRFAQECPEGNPGKYKQGETQWHSTKTKSL